MKKTKAKNYLKIGIMTLGISFLLTNCSKESISEQELNIGNQLNDLNVETVSFHEAIIFLIVVLLKIRILVLKATHL